MLTHYPRNLIQEVCAVGTPAEVLLHILKVVVPVYNKVFGNPLELCRPRYPQNLRVSVETAWGAQGSVPVRAPTTVAAGHPADLTLLAITPCSAPRRRLIRAAGVFIKRNECVDGELRLLMVWSVSALEDIASFEKRSLCFVRLAELRQAHAVCRQRFAREKV